MCVAFGPCLPWNLAASFAPRHGSAYFSKLPISSGSRRTTMNGRGLHGWPMAKRILHSQIFFSKNIWRDNLQNIQPRKYIAKMDVSVATVIFIQSLLYSDKVLKTSTHTTCANKAVLSISSVTKADEGEYRCVVRNAFGLKTSYPAQLTVCKSRDNIITAHSLTHFFHCCLVNPPFYTRIPATALLGLVLFVGGVLCALLIQRFLFYV